MYILHIYYISIILHKQARSLNFVWVRALHLLKSLVNRASKNIWKILKIYH